MANFNSGLTADPSLDDTAYPTVDISTLDISQLTYPSVTGATGSSLGGYVYTINNTTPYQWNTINSIGSTNVGSGLHVKDDAEFDGDIKWKGRSLGRLLEKIEDRLAILAEPDPAKLEKYAALKKAYDQYKLLEKLIGEE